MVVRSALVVVLLNLGGCMKSVTSAPLDPVATRHRQLERAHTNAHTNVQEDLTGSGAMRQLSHRYVTVEIGNATCDVTQYGTAGDGKTDVNRALQLPMPCGESPQIDPLSWLVAQLTGHCQSSERH